MITWYVMVVMQVRGCWRTTDNRHWDSPARMSDGRVFTDWRSPCIINTGRGHLYNAMLQTSGGYMTSRRTAESRVQTGDPWGKSYVPPPPKQLILPVAKSGVEILRQDLPGAIGAEVRSGNTLTSHIQPDNLTREDTRVSDCGYPAMPRCDPRWGLSSETLVLNMRDSTPAGGSTTAWLRGTLGDRV